MQPTESNVQSSQDPLGFLVALRKDRHEYLAWGWARARATVSK